MRLTHTIQIKKSIIINIMLCLFFFLCPLESYFKIGSITLLKFYQIGCIGVFTYLSSHGRMKLAIPHYLGWLLSFLGMLILSVFITTQLEKAINYLMAIGLQVIFIVITVQFQYSKVALRGYVLSYISGAAVLAIILVSGSQTVGNYTDRFSVAIGNSTIDPNNVAGLLVVGLAYLINLKPGNRATFFLKYGTVLLLGIGIVKTGSRGALVALGVVLVYVLVEQQNFKYFIMVALGILVGLALFYVVDTQILNLGYTENVIIRFISDGSGSDRTEIWTVVLQAAQKNLFFPYGLGAASSVVLANFGADLGPHNTYLLILLEGGLIALVTFLGIYISFYRNRKQFPYSICVCSGIVASMTVMVFLDVYNKKILWVPVILCYLFYCTEKERETL